MHDERGFLVRRPYVDDKMFLTIRKVQNSLRGLVRKQRAVYFGLSDVEGMAACGEIEEDIERLTSDGGVIDRVIDPKSGIRFQAEVIKR